jgi:1,2-dihydroxy-3-keto-5-methylthiopentene dioxygenase
MRAYALEDSNRLLGREDLERQGVLSWTASTGEAERSAVIGAIKQERRYIDEDVVELSPDTPDLDVICAKFDKEHHHTEDEVRFVLEGDGIFDVRDDADNWIRIEVTEGDIILIPSYKHHRFYLGERKHIRCMRLFANHDGWAPVYRNT